MKNVFILLATLLILGGCAQVYTSPQFASRTYNDKLVAILPFDVSINLKKLPKGVTYEQIQDEEKNEGYNLQASSYSRFLKKSENFTVQFQDIDKTNSILAKNGIQYNNMREISKDSLANLLQVDAVINTKILQSGLMSEAGAIVLAALTGIYGSTNQISIDMSIIDADDAVLLWKYNHKISGSVGSSSEQLADYLFKRISNKFPYTK